MRPVPLLTALTLSVSACSDVKNPDITNEGEVITTVELTLVPSAGGDELVFTWTDPENDGEPVIDAFTVPASTDFTASVRFLNALEDPAEDITLEVAEEADEHQVFFTGSAVAGPATDAEDAALTHAYADEDGNGLPVGLENDLSSGVAGTGDLVLTLRHMPPEGSVAVKVAGTAEAVAAGGFGAIGGDTDVSVTFAVTVE